MKKFIALTLLALFCVVGAKAQLLYQISGNGLKKDSYIIGSYHLASADTVNHIDGVNMVLNFVDMVCGELDMKDLSSPENVQRLQAAMCLPDGKYISDVLTAEQMAKLNSCMNDVIGTDFNNPLIYSTMGNMRPMVIAQQLQFFMYFQIEPDFDPTALMDGYFQKLALEWGKSVMGLESVDEQIAALYGSVSIEEEVADLMRIAEDPLAVLNEISDLSIAYIREDLEALGEIFMTNCSEEAYDRLLVKRNHKWMEKMPSIMSEQPTLFVVGAGHLIGEDGVIALLQNAGYSVEAVERPTAYDFGIMEFDIMFSDDIY